ncbi:MAG: DinB family protein, partial [Pseudomonadota bacterium]
SGARHAPRPRPEAMELVPYLVAQAHNNHWSNHRLHTACAALSAEDYHAQRPSFFGSIHAHLDHIVVVDWLYLERLTGEALLPKPLPEPLHAELPQLTRDQTNADRALIKFCEEVAPQRLDSTVSFTLASGALYTERVADVLAHLFQHQIHHRGQVHALLSATPVPPPQLDEFHMAGDLPYRVEELRTLGLAEG